MTNDRRAGVAPAQELDLGVLATLEAPTNRRAIGLVEAPVPEHAQVQAQDFVAPTSGRVLQALSVNGVRLLTGNKVNLDASERRDILELVSAEKITSVMIADTAPKDGIVALIRELKSRGVQVKFVDHHEDDYQNRDDLKRNNFELQRLLGDNFVSTNRNRAPSVSYLIPEGSLVRDRVGLYFSAPADSDGMISGLLGAGLNPDRLKTISQAEHLTDNLTQVQRAKVGAVGLGKAFEARLEMSVQEVLGDIDSPLSLQVKERRREGKEARDLLLRELPESERLIGKDAVCHPAWSSEFRDALGNYRVSARDALKLLALSVKDGDLSCEAGEELADCAALARARKKTIVEAVSKAGRMRRDGTIVLFDVKDALARSSDFKDPEMAQALFSGGPGEARHHEIKAAIRDVLGKKNKYDYLLVCTLTEEGQTKAILNGNGRYDQIKGGLDFKQIGDAQGVNLRAFVGRQAVVKAEAIEATIGIVAPYMQHIDDSIARRTASADRRYDEMNRRTFQSSRHDRGDWARNMFK